jgi:hypothetical protein
MTLILRNSSAQARIEGRNPAFWSDGDFIVVDTDIPVGRIYRELVSGERKWLWSIHQIPAIRATSAITPKPPAGAIGRSSAFGVLR